MYPKAHFPPSMAKPKTRRLAVRIPSSRSQFRTREIFFSVGIMALQYVRTLQRPRTEQDLHSCHLLILATNNANFGTTRSTSLRLTEPAMNRNPYRIDLCAPGCMEATGRWAGGVAVSGRTPVLIQCQISSPRQNLPPRWPCARQIAEAACIGARRILYGPVFGQ